VEPMAAGGDASPFEGVSVPAFLCGADAGVLEVNGPAGALIAEWVGDHRDHPAGEMLGCLNAGQAGCGQGLNCAECPVRAAIRSAAAGRAVERTPVAMHLVRGGVPRRVELRLSARPVRRGGVALALVLLEPSEWVP